MTEPHPKIDNDDALLQAIDLCSHRTRDRGKGATVKQRLFISSMAALFIGCAPVDEAPNQEPVVRVSQAGGSSVYSCAPYLVYSIYILPLYGDTSYPSWASQLVYPSGHLYRTRSYRLNGCMGGSTYAEPFSFAPYSRPGVTPIGGYPTSTIGMGTLNLGRFYLPSTGDDRVIYIAITPGSSLREAGSSSRLSWGELWAGYYRAGRIDDANGWPTGTYYRESVHAHRALIWTRDPSTQRWRDEFQFGAHGFRLETTDHDLACNSEDHALGSYIGYQSGSVQPQLVRYISCDPSVGTEDALPALTTVGVNADQEYVIANGVRLGDYIRQLVGSEQDPLHYRPFIREASNWHGWPIDELLGYYY